MTDNSKNNQARSGITKISNNDVICGRSGLALRHPGNVAYRSIIGQNREPYVTCAKAEKPRISKSIVAAIRNINGRFLEREDGKASTSRQERNEDGKPVTWRDIGDKRALEKTSQALREGQPELLKKLGCQKQGGLNHAGVSPQPYAMPYPNQMISSYLKGSTPSTESNKKQCLRWPQPPPRQQRKHTSVSRMPRPTASETFDAIGPCLLSKCWGFLSLSDVHSSSLTCTKWRDFIWKSAPLWEGLVEQRYPSHRQLPQGWCAGGRNEYFKRTTLMKCQHTPVRYLDGLPIPLQRKTPGTELMQQWNPGAIIFLVDVFSGRHHFDDDIPHYLHDPIQQKKRLGHQVPIYSSCIRVPSAERADSIDQDDPFRGLTLNDDRMCVFEEVQMSPECQEERDAIAALEDFHDATVGNNILNDGIQDVDGLYVEMSYYVEGGDVPKCEPIVLLSEHHTFFVNSKDGRMTYRTDVEPAWLPGQYGWDKCISVWNKEEALQRKKVLSRQISKYGNVPLPFDPQVELRLSPPGQRSMGHLWDGAFENDSKGNCSIFIEVGFSIGEDDFDCRFKNLVVPSLLSLWNDVARQKNRQLI